MTIVTEAETASASPETTWTVPGTAINAEAAAAAFTPEALALEAALIDGDRAAVLRAVFSKRCMSVDGAWADLLERTATVLRVHDADFDAYCDFRAQVDSGFRATLEAVLGPDAV